MSRLSSEEEQKEQGGILGNQQKIAICAVDKTRRSEKKFRSMLFFTTPKGKKVAVTVQEPQRRQSHKDALSDSCRQGRYPFGVSGVVKKGESSSGDPVEKTPVAIKIFKPPSTDNERCQVDREVRQSVEAAKLLGRFWLAGKRISGKKEEKYYFVSPDFGRPLADYTSEEIGHFTLESRILGLFLLCKELDRLGEKGLHYWGDLNVGLTH